MYCMETLPCVVNLKFSISHFVVKPVHSVLWICAVRSVQRVDSIIETVRANDVCIETDTMFQCLRLNENLEKVTIHYRSFVTRFQDNTFCEISLDY